MRAGNLIEIRFKTFVYIFLSGMGFLIQTAWVHSERLQREDEAEDPD